MRGFASEHWKTLIGFSIIGKFALFGALGLGWAPSIDLEGAAISIMLPFVFAPIVVAILANRRALPVELIVYLPLIVVAYPISRSFNTLLVIVAITSSLIASGILGRIFLVRARRYFGMNRCEQCSYDLRANATGRCPECGMIISEAGSRSSDFPGLRNCVNRPRLAIVLVLVVPVIFSIISMRYANPYESQLEKMFANNTMVGKSPTGINWAFGSSLASDLPDNTYAIEFPYVRNYGATAYITIEDDVVVRATLTQHD